MSQIRNNPQQNRGAVRLHFRSSPIDKRDKYLKIYYLEKLFDCRLNLSKTDEEINISTLRYQHRFIETSVTHIRPYAISQTACYLIISFALNFDILESELLI